MNDWIDVASAAREHNLDLDELCAAIVAGKLGHVVETQVEGYGRYLIWAARLDQWIAKRNASRTPVSAVVETVQISLPEVTP